MVSSGKVSCIVFVMHLLLRVMCVLMHVHVLVGVNVSMIGERERANLVVQLARFFYIIIYLRALHIPYISKCFYVNFFKRNHSWIQSVLRARGRQRLASETAAERERRLSQRRARDRARRAARSSPTSETRLVQMGSVERLYLQHGENYLNLSAFDDVLRDISCSSDVTPSTLLKAKPFT